MNNNHFIKLSDAKTGKTYIFKEIINNPEFEKQLFSLGLCVCDKIYIEHKLFFSGAIYCSILNYPEKIRLGIRKQDAKSVIIFQEND